MKKKIGNAPIQRERNLQPSGNDMIAEVYLIIRKVDCDDSVDIKTEEFVHELFAFALEKWFFFTILC